MADGTWQLAARLGYAWRRARRGGDSYSDPALEVVADLHAEALVRLGHRLQPRPGGGPAAMLQRAPEQVHSLVDLLVKVAVGGGREAPCGARTGDEDEGHSAEGKSAMEKHDHPGSLAGVSCMSTAFHHEADAAAGGGAHHRAAPFAGVANSVDLTHDVQPHAAAATYHLDSGDLDDYENGFFFQEPEQDDSIYAIVSEGDSEASFFSASSDIPEWMDNLDQMPDDEDKDVEAALWLDELQEVAMHEFAAACPCGRALAAPGLCFDCADPDIDEEPHRDSDYQLGRGGFIDLGPQSDNISDFGSKEIDLEPAISAHSSGLEHLAPRRLQPDNDDEGFTFTIDSDTSEPDSDDSGEEVLDPEDPDIKAFFQQNYDKPYWWLRGQLLNSFGIEVCPERLAELTVLAYMAKSQSQ